MSWCHGYRDTFWTWCFRKLTGVFLNSQAVYLHTFEQRHLYLVSFSTLDDGAESQSVS